MNPEKINELLSPVFCRIALLRKKLAETEAGLVPFSLKQLTGFYYIR